VRNLAETSRTFGRGSFQLMWCSIGRKTVALKVAETERETVESRNGIRSCAYRHARAGPLGWRLCGGTHVHAKRVPVEKSGWVFRKVPTSFQKCLALPRFKEDSPHKQLIEMGMREK